MTGTVTLTLRRTFISVAELVGVPGITGKKLTNHSQSGDAHAASFAATTGMLRSRLQWIADAMDASGENIIPLRRAR